MHCEDSAADTSAHQQQFMHCATKQGLHAVGKPRERTMTTVPLSGDVSPCLHRASTRTARAARQAPAALVHHAKAIPVCETSPTLQASCVAWNYVSYSPLQEAAWGPNPTHRLVLPPGHPTCEQQLSLQAMRELHQHELVRNRISPWNRELEPHVELYSASM
jgi:hypothetical protein